MKSCDSNKNPLPEFNFDSDQTFEEGDLIKDFQDVLITSSFQIEEHQFERKIAYQFFKYSFEIFSFLNKSSPTIWSRKTETY